jgi:hypothetical protein
VKLNAETLKFAGGAVIVLAAACIMLPDLLNYIGGLWRLAVMIVVVIGIACLIGNITGRMQIAKRAKMVQENKGATEESS